MKEAEKESKGTEYYKGYAAGYRDAMKDFGYILNTLKTPSYVPLQIPSMKEWWDSPPMWNSPITCDSKYTVNNETIKNMFNGELNLRENK